MRGQSEFQVGQLQRRQQWSLLLAGVGLAVILVVTLSHLTRSYLLNQAEDRVRDVMLEYHALHD